MAIKNNKNKKRKPTKQHAGKKQKETVYDRVSREIDSLMWDVATVADKLLDLLPAFKRLSAKNRRLIYGHMDCVMSGLEESIDDYYDTLPESEEESGSDDLQGLGTAFAGLVGIAAILSGIGSSPLQDSQEGDGAKFNWPDAIDIEGGKVEKRPKLLKPSKEGE